MCGRYTLRTNLNILLNQFAAEMAESELRNVPCYNIAPTQQVPTVRLADGKRQTCKLRWA